LPTKHDARVTGEERLEQRAEIGGTVLEVRVENRRPGACRVL
jgi:hypothetical protein